MVPDAGSQNALGRFAGWGADAIRDVEAGETIELVANLEAVRLITLLRTFLWFAERANKQGTMFSQSGQELKETRQAERNIREMMGGTADDETIVLATPVGDPGPVVALPLTREWVIGDYGRLSGRYTVVAQVDRVIGDAEFVPTIRLIDGLAATPLELTTVKSAMEEFRAPAKNLGVEFSEHDISINGPGLWLSPVAIFR